ncbi:DUF397 domain-containing protein [Actinomadura chokoriensis]|uniref:DUF397 domain-containing protein n=1 Tax=Actinomadura chokoriensis TaxID=454156 RepID=A0ABV4R484_9ACTN
MTKPESGPLQWRRSSHSTSEEDSMCVEVAMSGVSTIAARDSKDPDGPVLQFTPADWSTFLTRIKRDAIP